MSGIVNESEKPLFLEAQELFGVAKFLLKLAAAPGEFVGDSGQRCQARSEKQCRERW